MEKSLILKHNDRMMNSSASFTNSCSSSVVIENDDTHEKSFNKVTSKLCNINKSSSYISSPSFGRRQQLKTSCMSNGLTHEQLKEIYSSCIRLSSENKINIKNAFGLQLIDYMQDLLASSTAVATSSDTTSTTNFQVAGCTLDASVKIYSYRVDSVHSDAVKIAGTLGTEQLQSNNGNDDDNESAIDDANDSTDTCQNRKTNDQNGRRRKNVRQKVAHNRGLLTKLEKNLKNINLEQFCTDETNKKSNMYDTNERGNNCFVFGHVDSNPITSLLLNNFGPCNDKGVYSIDQSSNIFSSVKEVVWNESNIVKNNDTIMKYILQDFYDNEGSIKKINNLVGIVDNFKFLRWEKPDLHHQSNNISILDNINILTGIVDNESDRSAIEKHRKTLLQSVFIDTLQSMDESLKHDQSGLASDHNETLNVDETLENHLNTFMDHGDPIPEFPQQASAIEFDFPCRSEAIVSKNGNNASVATITNGNALSVAASSNVPLNMTGGVTLELSMEPGEYSYFKNLNQVQKNVSQIPNMWAGPEHWKHFSSSLAKSIGGESILSSRGSVIKTAAKTRQPPSLRKRRQLVVDPNFATNPLATVSECNVDFSAPLPLEAKKLFKPGKASFTYSKSILAPSNAESVTLQETDSVSMKPLFQLFLMPNVKLTQTLSDKDNVDEPAITFQDNHLYNYNNDNDRLNYCSGILDDVSHLHPFNDVNDYNHFGSGFLSPFKPSIRPTITQDECKVSNGLFANPATQLAGGMSQKNKIEYARYAKRFDTRQIKSTLWNILQHYTDDIDGEHHLLSDKNLKTEQLSQSPYKDNNVDDNAHTSPSNAKTAFNSVYHSLIEKLPTKSAQNISVPIAIVCLLHLANEKNLILQGNDQMDNIEIKLKSENNL